MTQQQAVDKANAVVPEQSKKTKITRNAMSKNSYILKFFQQNLDVLCAHQVK